MAKYRKKPIIVDAVQWRGDNYAEVCAITGFPASGIVDGPLDLETLEGTMRAEIGDWIIVGVKGEVYPCKPDIFEVTYEEVSAEYLKEGE